MSRLSSLREYGLRFQVAAGQLIVTPRSALTDELRAVIRTHKRNILNELAGALESPLAERQARVEAELRSRCDLRAMFDVVNAPLRAAPGEAVSVVLAMRHGEHILSGELHVSRERWNMALLIRTVGMERPS
jgi:hypothetical protein